MQCASTSAGGATGERDAGCGCELAPVTALGRAGGDRATGTQAAPRSTVTVADNGHEDTSRKERQVVEEYQKTHWWQRWRGKQGPTQDGQGATFRRRVLHAASARTLQTPSREASGETGEEDAAGPPRGGGGRPAHAGAEETRESARRRWTKEVETACAVLARERWTEMTALMREAREHPQAREAAIAQARAWAGDERDACRTEMDAGALEVLERCERMIEEEGGWDEDRALAELLWVWACLTATDESTVESEERQLREEGSERTGDEQEEGEGRRKAIEAVAETIESVRAKGAGPRERAAAHILGEWTAQWTRSEAGMLNASARGASKDRDEAKALMTHACARLQEWLGEPGGAGRRQTREVLERAQAARVRERAQALAQACDRLERAGGSTTVETREIEEAAARYEAERGGPGGETCAGIAQVARKMRTWAREDRCLARAERALSRMQAQMGGERSSANVTQPRGKKEETGEQIAPIIAVGTRARGAIGFNAEARREGAIEIPREGHLMTIGATGTGKTSGNLIPAALTHRGPIIVIDPKGEIYDVTHERRRAMGDEVWEIAPYQETPGRGKDGINPLETLDRTRAGVEARRLARSVWNATRGEERGDPFWHESAQDILTGVIAHIACDRSGGARTMREAARIGYLDERQSRAVTRRIERWSTARVARSEVGKLHQADSGTYNNVTAASMRLSYRHQSGWLADRRLASALDTTSVDLDRIRAGEGFALYISVPPRQSKTEGMLMRLMLATLLNVMMQRTRRPERTTLVLADEAAQLGELDELRLVMTLMRGYGVQIWTLWQDIAQLMRLYEDWPTLLGNTHTVIATSPHADAGGWGGVESAGHAALAARLATGRTPQEGEVLVSQTGKPARVMRLVPYFADARLKGLYTPDPRHAKTEATHRAAGHACETSGRDR